MGDKTKVVGGPITVLFSSTTLGETESGFVIRGTAAYNEITTHESGLVPVSVHQQGGRRWEIEINEVECGATAMARIFQDATQSGTVIQWEAAQANKTLTSLGSMTVQQSNAGGSALPFLFNNVVPAPDGIELIGKNADGSKWVFNTKWICLWDSATYAQISGLS